MEGWGKKDKNVLCAPSECPWMIYNTNWRLHEPLGKLWLHFSSASLTPTGLAFVSNRQEEGKDRSGERVRKSGRDKPVFVFSYFKILNWSELFPGLIFFFFLTIISLNYQLNQTGKIHVQSFPWRLETSGFIKSETNLSLSTWQI